MPYLDILSSLGKASSNSIHSFPTQTEFRLSSLGTRIHSWGYRYANQVVRHHRVRENSWDAISC